jgi:Mg2+ and Co2+ transporter CorA
VFLRTPDGAWSFQGQPGGEQALRRLLDAYQERLTKGLAAYDQANDAADLFALIERARPVGRASGNLYAALQAAREAVRDDAELITARDSAADINRGLELLLADAQLALNFRLAQQAETQTRAALANHRAQEKLNTLAAWTLPLMAVGAVFGMNLRNGGETTDTWLFWTVLAAGIVVGWWVKVWVQRPHPPEKKKALSPTKARVGVKLPGR